MYDLIVIGGGPGGYTGALEAAKIGKKVLLLEKSLLGGVCLNSGCIPTKSLIHSSKLFGQSLNMSEYGVDSKGIKFNINTAQLRKDRVVSELRENLKKLLLSKGIKIIKGEAKLFLDRTIEVNGESYTAHKILIATGSKSKRLDAEGSSYLSNLNDIFNLKKIPHSITIIGAGVIGVEFASFFSMIGTEVNLIEIRNSILPGFNERLVKKLRSLLKVNYLLETRITRIDSGKIYYKTRDGEGSIDSEIAFNAIGREPNSESFMDLGIVLNGKIQVNSRLETNIEGVYAVGDVTDLTYLAHGASYMAEVAVKNMYGSGLDFDPSVLPSVVYSSPELASVGLTEKEAKIRGIDIIKTTIKLNSNGRYRAENNDNRGMCIIIANRLTRDILGVHMLGHGVSEIISNASLAIKQGLTIEEFRDNIFPHPTLSESIKDSMFFL